MTKKKTIKKSGWVWWVVGKSHAWHGGMICNGPYPTRKQAIRESCWDDEIIRKSKYGGPPREHEDDAQ
jgi:hypothetical protein